jgi:hypothetical protein
MLGGTPTAACMGRTSHPERNPYITVLYVFYRMSWQVFAHPDLQGMEAMPCRDPAHRLQGNRQRCQPRVWR